MSKSKEVDEGFMTKRTISLAGLRGELLDKVRELHVKWPPRLGDDDAYCKECQTGLSRDIWPCPTIRALDGE